MTVTYTAEGQFEVSIGTPPAGNSDNFSGDLSNWTAMSGSLANCTTANGHFKLNADWTNIGAYYTTATKDTSQITLLANMWGVASAWACVRMDTSSNLKGYAARLTEGGTGNYIDLEVWKDGGGWAEIGNSDVTAFNYAVNASHTIEITVSGSTSPVSISVKIDGVERYSGSDSSSPLTTSGAPGFYIISIDGTKSEILDNWTDTP